VHEAAFMRFGEGPAHLNEDRHHAAGRLRTVEPHEVLEIDAIEVFHRVVEDAVGRASVVVDGYGVRMTQLRGQLHLPLEPHEIQLTGPVRRQQLDGGRTPQHRVAGPIDHAHAAGADPALERILAQAPHSSGLGTQAEDHA
jgi:hypothetical protein